MLQIRQMARGKVMYLGIWNLNNTEYIQTLFPEAVAN